MTKHQDGQIIIIALVFVVVVMGLVTSMVGYTVFQLKSSRQGVAREQGLNIAEAGVETAIWKLNHVGGYTGETTNYANGTYVTTLTNLSNSTRLVTVNSYVPNQTNPVAHRRVQVTAVVGTKNFGFTYGVQMGTGGLLMDNNSQVTGNVYSNGNIVGGNNGSVITGDVIVAGSTGSISNLGILGNSTSHSITNSSVTKNANHYSLTSTTVGGNASVNSLSGPGCSVTGNAVYNTKSNCTVTGTATTPNNSVPADPAVVPLPIDAAQISNWETEAASGGTIPGQTVSGTVSLGPVKVNGDLIINGYVTMIGTIWVTGNITINNGSTIQLDPSFGALSGEILAGTSGTTTTGLITINNGSTILGSGTSGSYVMLLSEKNTVGTANIAISVGNNVAAAILYANDGLVEVINRAALKEITAWKIHLNNLTNVTYDTGYASAEFTTGPTGGWELQDQTWQLLQ